MRHPMDFADFHGIWQVMQGTASSEDAYDAYLAGLSESLQQAAMCCDQDEVQAYMGRITEIVHMRRDHAQGLHHSTQNLKRAIGGV